MTKYIRLYEDYTDLEQKSSEKHHSWNEIRDIIQAKLPFIIIDFKDDEAQDKCIKEELFDEDFVKQSYFLKDENGEDQKSFPSVFIFSGGEDLKARVLDFLKRFHILRIVIGEYGKNYPQLYAGGETVDLGSELFSSLERGEMSTDDFYKVDSNFYKFIQ